MTVRLLVPAYGKQTNALYTGTQAAERALIDAGQADNQLDASFDYPAYLAGKSMAVGTLTQTSVDAAVASGVGFADPTARAVVARIGALPKWRRAMARVRAGKGRGRILIVGDSTKVGVGAGSGGFPALTGARARSFGVRLAEGISQAGLLAVHTNFMGTGTTKGSGGNGVFATGYDPRLTFGAGWTYGTADGVGGPMFFNGTTTNSMDFAIPGQSDTIEIYSPRNSGLGAFTAAVDGGAVLQTVVQDGVDGFIKTTITVTRGAHTLNLSRVSGLVFITGVIAFDSTVPAVDVVSAGWSSSTAGLWVFASSAFTFGAIRGQSVIGPDLTIIALTINEALTASATPIATYRTSLQALITQAKLSGDCLLMTGMPSDFSLATADAQAQVVAVMAELAASNDLLFINNHARTGGWAALNALGEIFDGLHGNDLYYADEANATRAFLMDYM